MTALNSSPAFRTCWARPYALVKWGAGTRLAFINGAVAKSGEIVGFRGFYCDKGWKPTTNVRPIEPDSVIAEWRSRPLNTTVATRRRTFNAKRGAA